MNRLLADFPWPKLPGSTSAPSWQGGYFMVGNTRHEVLCYEKAESHWSPELTELHEAEAGSNHPIDQASRKLAVQSLRRFASRSDQIVLDVGCSSGYLLEELRRAEPELALIGSDFIAPPLFKLAGRQPGTALLQFDLRRCPLPDACIDVAIALNVLEHIDDDALALREVWRILKPGGLLHLEVPAGPHLYDIYDEHLLHHRRYELKQLVQRARQTGFAVLKATHLGAFIYPAFALIKRRNRRLLTRSPEEKKLIVARQIRETSRSTVMRAILAVEIAFGRLGSYPFGIRCVVVMRKPSSPSAIASTWTRPAHSLPQSREF